ncbi:MAG: hypothetical protein KDE35_06015 [Geminicoccaceae bacterium]|nr:hypothetical protein [Geminicoccaceae bacterium]
MRTQVERFSVNIKPPQRRFDVELQRPRGGVRAILGWVVLALPTLAVGALSYDLSGSIDWATRPMVSAQATIGDIMPAAGTVSSSDDSISLQRAGDGAFYVDVMLGEQIVTARVDLDRALSTIAAHDLQAAAADGSARVSLPMVRVEGRQLADVSLAVDEATVLGRDLLDRLGHVETDDVSLRLAAR